jgi:hypothetical protein
VTQPEASWPDPPTSPRILLEAAPGERAEMLERTIRAQGYDVAVCGGPSVMEGGCPLLRGEACSLADGADLIVHALEADESGIAVLHAHAREHPPIPALMIVPSPRRTPARGVPSVQRLVVDQPAPHRVVLAVTALLSRVHQSP